LKEDHVRALHADGSETQPADGDGLGRRHYFRTVEGGLIPQVIPPAGFDPETASPQELTTYGYPARPDASSADRATWDTHWGGKLSALQSQAVGYCEAPGLPLSSANAPATAAPEAVTAAMRKTSSLWPGCYIPGRVGAPTECWSSNFGGGYGTVNPNPTPPLPKITAYTEANMGWYQSAFDQNCSGKQNDGYVTWAGLGGFGSKLMQSGTFNSGTIFPNDYQYSPFFWEVVGPDYPDKIMYQFDGFGISAKYGDDVQSYVAYGTTQSGYPGQGLFTAHDSNLGIQLSTGYMPSVTGTNNVVYPMSNFYDGSTADFITERPRGTDLNGNLFQLRYPHLKNTLIYFASANGYGIPSLPGVNVETETYGNEVTQTQSSEYNGATAWEDWWTGCL
jgi:hypothetical protein